jgi:hypothetical protein
MLILLQLNLKLVDIDSAPPPLAVKLAYQLNKNLDRSEPDDSRCCPKVFHVGRRGNLACFYLHVFLFPKSVLSVNCHF